MPLSRLRHRFPSTEPFIPLLEEIRHTMTEWWLRKAVIRHLFPIFCNYYFIRDGITMSPLTRSVGSVTLAVVLLPDTLSFQLTRSVGSVTLHIVYVKSHHHNRADILLKITLKSDIFLHNMYYIFSEPPYKTNITARSLTKSSCPQGHMFPLHLYAPLSSSNYYPNNRIEGYLVLHQ